MKIIVPQWYLDDGLVSTRRHPTLPLTIYNYTPKVQFDKLWDRVTLMCRGLILDDDNFIVGWPLPKFFNLGEVGVEALPKNERFTAWDKMDGSLIIVCNYNGDLIIASRGSFVSDQACVAREILLRNEHEYFRSYVDGSYTYLFEVIYPENRIVVDYGDTEDLVGLAMVDNNTGRSKCFPTIFNFTVPSIYPELCGEDLTDIVGLSEKNWPNKEGVVLFFYDSDFRVKVKFDEYVRLHRIMMHLSEIQIWRDLRDGVSFSLVGVPDEFFNWVKKTILDLKTKFRNIHNKCKIDFQYVKDRPCQFKTRKEVAAYFTNCRYPHLLFHMYDKNEDKLRKDIFKLIRPKGTDHENAVNTPLDG